MSVQAVFLDEVYFVCAVRYAWSADGAVLLTLDTCVGGSTSPLTFKQLQLELRTLCPWQAIQKVVIGLKHALAEVITVYHAFECAKEQSETLMLICTPPDEYFDAVAA